MKNRDYDPIDLGVERITAAALRIKYYTDAELKEGGNIWAPWHYMIICARNHGQCFKKCKELNIHRNQNQDIQGFYTSKNRFVDRAEALSIAKAANQIVTKHPPLDELCSEDLYS